MAAGKILNTSNPLYSSITRALSGDVLINKLVALDGGADTATQPHHYALTAATGNAWVAQQGIARNDTHWFGLSSGKLEKYDLNNNLIVANNSPYATLPAGLNHTGGGFVDDTYLYTPVEDAPLIEGGLAIYLISDLSLHAYVDFKGLGFTQAAGCCLSKEGAEILMPVFEQTVSSSRAKDIHRLDYVTKAYLGKYVLDDFVYGMQDITYHAVDDAYYATSHPGTGVGTDRIAAISTSFEVVSLLDPTASSAELEGVCSHNDVLYYHELNNSPRTVKNETVLISADLTNGTPTQVIDNPLIEDEGTILLNFTLIGDGGFPMIMDSQAYAGNWVWYVDNGNGVRFRIDPSQQAVTTTNISTLTNYKIACSWVRTGGTVVCKIGVNGVWEDTTAAGTWTAPPADGLWLGGENAGSTRSDIIVEDQLLFDKQLSDAELLDSYTNFDDFYAQGVTPPEPPTGPQLSQNQLLAAIVIAVGGTVTQPVTRNSLLQDWLDAL